MSDLMKGRLGLVVALAVLAALFAAPRLVNGYVVYILALMCINALMASGFNFVIGFLGQLVFANTAFFGIGAYACGIVMVHTGAPFVVAFIVACLVGGVAGLIVGLPALRLTGFQLAIVTLAFNELMRWIYLHSGSIGGGASGLELPDAYFFGVELFSDRAKYIFILAATAIAIWMVRNIARSTVGRAIVSVGASELAAASLTIPPVRYKIMAFGLSGFFTAMSGALFALLLGRIAPESFSLNQLLLGFCDGDGGRHGHGGGPGAGRDPAHGRAGVPAQHRGGRGDHVQLPPDRSLAVHAEWSVRWIVRACAGPARASSGSRAMTPRLKLENVGVQFAGLRAVSDVSFEVAPGEICAVIGPNGAGKSTLFNAIGGYVRSTGQVWLDDAQLSGKPIHEIAAFGVRRTFQNGGLFPDLTVIENVAVGLHQSHNIPLLSGAFSLPSARRMEADAVRQARELLDLMGILSIERVLVRDLSSGQRRIIEIARALAVPAKLLMLDEPAVGLTTLEIEHLDQILKRLALEGISVLLVEHVLDLVMSVSDKVVVLSSGERLAVGTPAEVRQDQAVLEAYLGYSELC
ncbi:ABC-type branched-subunit amino acid transport system ATPase component/ABC-type branched-subunit amino acid transport system permease subunit [Bradyrhizobium sp. LM6.10]